MPLLLKFDEEKFEMRAFKEYVEKKAYSQKGTYELKEDLLILKFTKTRSDTLKIVKNTSDSLILSAPSTGAKITLVPLPKYSNAENKDKLNKLLASNLFELIEERNPENKVIEFLDKSEYIYLDSFTNFFSREKTIYATDIFEGELFLILSPSKLVHIENIQDNKFIGTIQDNTSTNLDFSGFTIESRGRFQKIMGTWKSDSLELYFSADTLLEKESGKQHSYIWKFNLTEDIIQMRLPEINKTLKEIRVINIETKTLEIERFNYFKNSIERLILNKI